MLPPTTPHPRTTAAATPPQAPVPDWRHHRQRRGWQRLWHATKFSLQGLWCAWQHQAAFRLEAYCAAALLPASLWVGHTWAEHVLLAASVVAVLVMELLNSAVEAVVDRTGEEWHPLAKQAKDLASAAVLLNVLLAAGLWGSALWHSMCAG